MVTNSSWAVGWSPPALLGGVGDSSSHLGFQGFKPYRVMHAHNTGVG